MHERGSDREDGISGSRIAAAARELLKGDALWALTSGFAASTMSPPKRMALACWWTGSGREGCAKTPGLDAWAKDVAPSAELRTWYRYDPAKFDEFRRRYTAELDEPGPREALARLRALAADRPVTLLTATRDLNLSQAAVLAGLLREPA